MADDSTVEGGLTPQQQRLLDLSLIEFADMLGDLKSEGISLEIAEELVRRDVLIDGRAGGLILGRPHEDGGGIMVLVTDDDGEQLHYCGQTVEGWEYVLNERASHQFLTRVIEMNRYSWDDITRYTVGLVPSPSTPVIDVTIKAPTDVKFLWLNPAQLIVNRRSASERLSELDEMNRFSE